MGAGDRGRRIGLLRHIKDLAIGQPHPPAAVSVVEIKLLHRKGVFAQA